MPSSEAPARWRSALALAGIVLVLVLGAVGARVVWFDAYWVFRREPPWLATTGGASRLLDRQMRRAKTLQAMTRPYATVLIGSSTTYSGLDPRDADLAPPGGIYNLGISGLLADELPIVASLAAARPGLRRAVLGLDYYMFARADRAVRLDRSLGTMIGRANALGGSLLGRYAIADSRLRAVARRAEPGAWTYDGFRLTPKLTPDLTRQNDTIRRQTTVPFRPAALADLGRALDILAGREVAIFLPPVSRAQRRVMADLGLAADLAVWRGVMAEFAASRGIRFVDLADLGADDPFDPDRGSTEAWLDNLHFTPVIGREVLETLGLRRRPPG